VTQLKEEIDDAQRRENDDNPLVVWTHNFTPIYPGPNVEDMKVAFPSLWRKEATIGAWNTPATVANGFRTILVPDPKDPKYGVWGLASTARSAVRQQVEAGDAVPSGWYYRVMDRVPTAQQFQTTTARGKPLLVGQQYFQAYYETHPDEDPALKQAAEQKKIDALRALKAIELTVWGNGTTIQVAKTDEQSSDQEGAHPGVTILGPTAWFDASKGQSPAQLGLPMPLIATDDGVNVHPAVDEYNSILAESKRGSWKAQKALAYLGLGPDPGAPGSQASSNPFAALFNR